MRNPVVGSRGSRLAVLQAQSVIDKIHTVDQRCNPDLCKIVTSGDRDRQTSLGNLGIAAFVKELEEALIDGRIDMAVHSLKDVPTELPEGLRLVGVTERADPRDILVARARLMELEEGATLATGSLRRAVQLAAVRQGLNTCSIRGNVDTRMKKIAAGQADGMIMAAAALIRMGWQDRITEYLPLEHFLPSVGQGAIVIEARADDREAAELASLINDIPAWQAVTAERAFLRELGGGCRAPIAALGTTKGNTIELRGMVAGPCSRNILRDVIVGNAVEAIETGKTLARRMLDMGAANLIAEAEGL